MSKHNPISMKARVVFFQRKQRPLGNFSVEIYFDQIRDNLPDEVLVETLIMPYESSGVFKRIANALYCAFHQGDVNHITGDIHYVATFLKKSKTILTVLDCGIVLDSIGLRRKILEWFWFKIPVNRSQIVTGISNATKQDTLKITGCNPSKIRVIYFLSNIKFKKHPSKFNKQEPNLLQIGTAPNKNIPRLIEAIKGISCTLTIVGKVNEELREMLSRNQINHTIFDVRLSDEEIEELYRKCDIVAFASTLEGFGMPIIEGNTIGRAVLTSNVTSMPEVALDCAVLVDPFNVEDIRKGVLKIINEDDFRNEMIERGYSNVDRFKVETIAAEYAQLYRELYEFNNNK
ncbi:MAG: glycosyltransferase family 4 protein [Bacteroidetes bacterium]|nr:glycosyltransferase family 4 protein [Bacteroidota bacterium]